MKRALAHAASKILALAAASVLLVSTASPLGAATASPEPTDSPMPCVPVVFPASGTYDAASVRRGPGLVLVGTGAGPNMPHAAFTWMRAHLGRSDRGRAGNALILRASGDRENTAQFYREGRFAFVEEILLSPCVPRESVDEIAAHVDRADVVFFAGGDQSHYAAWKGSKLIAAVQRVYARGGIVGGGSAGLAIQGAIGYDSVAADRLHPGDDDWAVTTANALKDPLEPEISFTTLFDWPPLRDTIADTHFRERNRFGRLVAFLARIRSEGLGKTPYYGLGVDRGSAVLVEGNGTATVRVMAKSTGAYLVRAAEAIPLQKGTPLRASVDVAHFGRDGQRFDLGRKRPGIPWRKVSVDGSRTPAYEPDPYHL